MYLWPRPLLWSRVSYAITYLTIPLGYFTNISSLTCLSRTLGSTLPLLQKPAPHLDFLISTKEEDKEEEEEKEVEEVVMMKVEDEEEVTIYPVPQGKSLGNVFAASPVPSLPTSKPLAMSVLPIKFTYPLLSTYIVTYLFQAPSICCLDHCKSFLIGLQILLLLNLQFILYIVARGY